jgi:TIR domain
MPKIHDIFLSYASQDRAKAKILAEALERKGWLVWWDRRIPPGKRFEEVISEALNGAKCVVVLWSDASLKSDWVKEEAAEGARREILLPALIDNVEVPLGFRRIQAAHLAGWKPETPDPEFEQLVQSIASIVGGTREPIPGVQKEMGGAHIGGAQPPLTHGVVAQGGIQAIRFWTLKWIVWGPLCGAMTGLILGVVDDGARILTLELFVTWVGGGALWGLLGGVGVGILFGALSYYYHRR